MQSRKIKVKIENLAFWEGAISNRIIIEALPDKMRFKSRSERIAGQRHVLWKKSL